MPAGAQKGGQSYAKAYNGESLTIAQHYRTFLINAWDVASVSRNDKSFGSLGRLPGWT